VSNTIYTENHTNMTHATYFYHVF